MLTFKQYLEEKDPCWKGYKQLGMKKKNGKEVPNCIPEEAQIGDFVEFDDGTVGEITDLLEAEYQGRSVELNKPMPGDRKQEKVYVKNKKGNIVKVEFGDPNSTIKKHIPARRKSFRARHNCETATDKTTARYWSCKKW